jgi:orotidine-5'-phosphate decarboxylase
MNTIEKYNRRVDEINSLVCVGLDTDSKKLPDWYKKRALPQLDFNRHIITETAEFASAYKFNMAFYEANGAEGINELALSVEYLRDLHPNIPIICDAKRSDIGNTSEAYAYAIFEQLGFDAVTLNPYLGRDALQSFLDYKDKACIILCRTSNQGSGEFQNLKVDGKPLWQIVTGRVATEWNANDNCMLVMGATYPDELAQVRSIVGDMTLLVPGIGAQGGDIEATVKAGLNRQSKGLIINSSRGIIFSKKPKSSAQTLRDKINKFRS